MMLELLKKFLQRWSYWGLKRVRKASHTPLRLLILEDRTVPSFLGGVSVAAGDLDGDGFTDIISGAGSGGGPHVRIFSGKTGEMAREFFAYAPTFSGGVFVAVGDVTGDGRLDVVTSAGTGGGPHVKVFDGVDLREVRSFYAFESTFTGGTTVAVGDVNGDGHADIVTGTQSQRSDVQVFDGVSGVVLKSFSAYSGFTGGVSVASGDLDGDGCADIVTGAGEGGGPHVKAFSGRDGRELLSFFAYETFFSGGVHVALGDTDGDGRDEIFTGAGVGAGPRARLFAGSTGQPLNSPVSDFFAFSTFFTGGLFVALADLDADGRADLITGAGPGGGSHVRGFRATDAAEVANFMAYDPLTTNGSFSQKREFEANTPPKISSILDQSVFSGQSTNAIPILISDRESTVDSLDLEIHADDPALLPSSTFRVIGTGANRSLIVTPGANRVGKTNITITVSDQGHLKLSASTTFSIEIQALVDVNRSPNFVSVPVLNARVGNEYLYDADAVDPDGDEVTYAFAGNVPSGMSIDSVNGKVSWYPTVQQIGTAFIRLAASDRKGGIAEQSFTILVTTQQTSNTNPTITGIPTQSILSGESSLTLPFDVGDAETPATALVVTAISSNPAVVPSTSVELGGTAGLRTAIIKTLANTSGTSSITLTVTDADGLAAATTFQVNVLASPTLPTLTSTADFSVSTSFLYTGTNPVQTGMAVGTINPIRAAVLRGKVVGLDGLPVAGVTVSVLSHPEYGQTLTHSDGTFDMAVNGGGLLTVNYERSGYLTLQRQADVSWQDYTILPEVALSPLDKQVTTVDLNSSSPIQVARGSVETDTDGSRQATLLFQQGVHATMTLADGSVVPLNTLHVRATEYTVGTMGPMAMPGTLPASSGYTYAVELSVDEAMAAGAKRVDFDRAVPFYVENFLHFPVGMTVPAGYYDRERGIWIASDNGRVVEVLSVISGEADLDTDGDGDADTFAELKALGITDAERIQLASLYQPGQSVWRVPMTHFTPWDCNWPYGPPPGAKPPDFKPDELKDNDQDDQNKECGSVIGVENQTLGERVPVAGTPFSLVYQSDRVSGNVFNRSLAIPLTRNVLPPDLVRVELTVSIAGREFKQSLAPAASLSSLFIWDGRDAYGRPLHGYQNVSVEIAYVYNRTFYQEPTAIGNSFGLSSGIILTDNPSRSESTLSQKISTSLRASNQTAIGMGGWTLSVQHRYDPTGNILHLGTGSDRTSDAALGRIINTVAGNGKVSYAAGTGDGLQAKDVGLEPYSVAVGPDGSLYIAEIVHSRDTNIVNIGFIRRVRDGIITTIAGVTGQSYSGDGGMASQAGVMPSSLAVGRDGSIYFSDTDHDVIRQIQPDGIIRTIAGGGIISTEGVLATQSRLYNPAGITIGADGCLYLCELGGVGRVRRIGLDGIITTIAGGGADYYPSNIPATRAAIGSPKFITISPDGVLYIVDQYQDTILRLGADGIISIVAGSGTSVNITPDSISYGPDGNVYFYDRLSGRIRRLEMDGKITSIAGSSPPFLVSAGDGGQASAAQFYWVGGLAFNNNGYLLLTDIDGELHGRVRQLSLGLPGFTSSPITISTEDGSGIYSFDSKGRHLQTLDALTGTSVYTFGYDIAGRLTSVIDADNNVTTIEHDQNGNPTAIVSAFGQRTKLQVDNDGYLATITNPANETTTLGYADGGLLTSMTDPLGHASTMQYDAGGRLIKDQDAANGFTELTREELGGGSYKVTTTNAVNGTRKYLVENLSDGSVRRTAIDGRGFAKVTLIGTDGSRTTTSPDGTVTKVVYGPDPRFGMLAPVVVSQSVTTPSGLTSTTTDARTATFAVANDPSSALQVLTDTVVLNGKTFTSVYDAATRTVTSTSAEGRTSSTTTDENGRVISSAIPGVVPTLYTYDSRGRLDTVSQGNRTVTYAYNDQGYLAQVTDPLGRSTRLAYNAAGRITQQVQTDGSLISFRYDIGGRLVGLTPPGKPEHTFTYDDRNLLTKTDPPDAFAGNDTTQYTYNLAKQLTREALPDGSIIDFTYCECGRLTSITAPWGNYAYTYSTTTGQLTTLSGPGGFALETGYDGILTTSATTTGPVAGQVNWTYDSNFRVVSESVNGATPVTFGYDNDGLMTRAGDLTLGRDANNGRLTGSTLGTVTDTVSYDDFGDESGYQANIGGDSAYQYLFTKDALGRITQKVETINGVTKTTDYGYDLKSQLVSVTENGVLVQSYSYDANGNRLSLTTPSGMTSGTYDAQDRLLTYGTKSYAYSPNGSLRSVTDSATGQTTNYTYDGFGALTRVDLHDGRVITYLIDPSGRRVGKQINGVLTQGLLYDGQLTPVATLDVAGNIVARFVYATGVNVPDYMIKDGVTYRLIRDQLGSVRLVVNVATGEVVQQLDYDAFGRVILDSNSGFQPFGYAGGLYDPDTGLVRFGARDYDAVTGRWTAEDPIGFRGGSGNLLSYSLNNPVSLSDPQGLAPAIPIGTPSVSIVGQRFGHEATIVYDGSYGIRHENSGGKTLADQVAGAMGPFSTNADIRHSRPSTDPNRLVRPGESVMEYTPITKNQAEFGNAHAGLYDPGYNPYLNNCKVYAADIYNSTRNSQP